MTIYQVLELVDQQPVKLRTFASKGEALALAVECAGENLFRLWGSMTEEEKQAERPSLAESLAEDGKLLNDHYALWLLEEELKGTHPLMLLKANELLRRAADNLEELRGMLGGADRPRGGLQVELLDYLAALREHALAAYLACDNGGDGLSLLVSDSPVTFERALAYFELGEGCDFERDNLTCGFGFEIVDLDAWVPPEQEEEDE